MRIVLQQTGCKEDLGETRCCICRRKFYLGPATCFALSERSRVLWGEVCPACLARGREYIEDRLEWEASLARLGLEQKEEAAVEGITDCPSLEEFLVAETFYQTPRFRTSDEYFEACDRGEIDLGFD